jgi:hypothetical protein
MKLWRAMAPNPSCTKRKKLKLHFVEEGNKSAVCGVASGTGWVEDDVQVTKKCLQCQRVIDRKPSDRNMSMYNNWVAGVSQRQIARDNNVSSTTVAAIVHRLENKYHLMQEKEARKTA